MNQVHPKTAIIILNWNGWQDTLECLDSVTNLAYEHFQIFVVDNNSTDESIEQIRDWCGSKNAITCMDWEHIKKPDFHSSRRQLVLIKNKKNLGYAGGNNSGISIAARLDDYQYFWILNNDTVVDPLSLTELIQAGEKQLSAGILGSRIFYYQKPEQVQSLGGFQTVWRRRKIRTVKDGNKILLAVQWVNGASLLIKKEVIRDIGLMDENFFLYGEEKEWCVRARKKGWSLYTVLNSRIYHKEGSSTDTKIILKNKFGRTAKRLPLDNFRIKLYYESRNGIYFVKKHYPHHLPLYFILRTLHLLSQVFLYDNHKMTRTAVILQGSIHGLASRMGRNESII